MTRTLSQNRKAIWKRKKYRSDPEYRARLVQAREARKPKQNWLNNFRYATDEQFRLTSKRKSVVVWARRRGMTVEEIARTELKQNRMCAVYGEPLNPFTRSGYHVEHCHQTGKLRGIVHGKCNRLIGAVESPLFKRVVAYLRRSGRTA